MAAQALFSLRTWGNYLIPTNNLVNVNNFKQYKYSRRGVDMETPLQVLILSEFRKLCVSIYRMTRMFIMNAISQALVEQSGRAEAEIIGS